MEYRDQKVKKKAQLLLPVQWRLEETIKKFSGAHLALCDTSRSDMYIGIPIPALLVAMHAPQCTDIHANLLSLYLQQEALAQNKTTSTTSNHSVKYSTKQTKRATSEAGDMSSKMAPSRKKQKEKDQRVIQSKRSDSPVSNCVSMKSEQSMGLPSKFRDVDSSPAVRVHQEESKMTSIHLEKTFKDLELKLISLVKKELKRFKKLLSAGYPACSEREVEDEEDQSSSREEVLKITLNMLRNMEQPDLANTLQSNLITKHQKKLKSRLKMKFHSINEGISQHGRSALLNEIYTELYITEGGIVKASRKAELFNCDLTEKSCAALSSALSSSSSSLRELNLSINELQDAGVELLSAGLKSPYCKLETLKLCKCKFTEESCAALASALSSISSSLRELHLSHNELQDSGVELLSAGLKNRHCKLETLELSDCNLTGKGCIALSSALSSNSSSLRELILSNNKLQDSGVELLSAGLKDPHCKLKKLEISNCGITGEGCAALASALKSNPNLKELNLTFNKPGESGVKLLSDLLEDPHCKLEKLHIYSTSSYSILSHRGLTGWDQT
ncbi:hypothetical protein AOLI_G00152510 [Acnodon oligacanthus]